MTQEAESKITVFTVSWFSTELIERLFMNLNEKAESPQRIDYFVIDNTAGKDHSVGRLKQIELPINIYPNNPREQAGSFAHALGMNFGFSKIQTEFALAVDPDIHIFKDNWDSFAIDLINTQDCSAVGTTYPQWQLGKYHNFPNPVFCLFRTQDFRAINADWTAYSQGSVEGFFNFARRQIMRIGGLINRKRYESSPAARKISTTLENLLGLCSHDTGWQIAEQARRNKLKAVLFRAVLADDNVLGSTFNCFKELAGQFELYYYENEPILTHKYSTGSRVWRTSRGSDIDFWQQCVKNFQKELTEIHRG